MLGGPGVPNNLPDAVTGIEIGQKADALFFLQTARVDKPPSDEERREGAKVEIARYVVHYEDGTSASIPITAEVNVDSYKQTSPRALSGAELAWVKPYTGTEFSAVVYCLQWTNPRPDEPIVTVDLTYPETRRGVPALLALTAAKRADQGQGDSRPVLR